eukprot:s603_g5.t1
MASKKKIAGPYIWHVKDEEPLKTKREVQKHWRTPYFLESSLANRIEANESFEFWKGTKKRVLQYKAALRIPRAPSKRKVTFHLVYSTNWICTEKIDQSMPPELQEASQRLAARQPLCCEMTSLAFCSMLARAASENGFEVRRWPVRDRSSWLAVGAAAKHGEIAGPAAVMLHAWHGKYEKECIPAWDYYPVLEAVKSRGRLLYPSASLDQLHSEKRYTSALMPPTKFLQLRRTRNGVRAGSSSVREAAGLSWGGYAVRRLRPEEVPDFVERRLVPKMPEEATELTVLLQAKIDLVGELRWTVVDGKLRGRGWTTLGNPQLGRPAITGGYKNEAMCRSALQRSGLAKDAAGRRQLEESFRLRQSTIYSCAPACLENLSSSWVGQDEFDALTSRGGSAVRALKQRVRWATGIGIFRQSLIRDGCVLKEQDKLEFPMDLQLVVAPCLIKMSRRDFLEMQSAVRRDDTQRLEVVLGKGLLITAGAGISGAQREAFELGNVAVTNFLLQAGVDVNEPGDDGRAPLHWVCRRGHVRVLQALLEARASVNVTDSRNATPLFLAADSGKVEAVQMLIQGAADLDQATASGTTALQIALGNRRLDIARLLLEARADWSSSPDSHQAPALLIASEQFDWYMVCVLLDAKASIDAVDSLGRTALHHAFLKPQDVESMEMARLLIERTADVNKTRAGLSDRVHLLVEAKADLNLQNCRAETSLHLASRSGHHEVVKQLLENRAETDLADARGRTPLLRAAELGHPETVNLLLAYRADVGRADVDSFTPLLEAAGCGNLECTRLLIQAGADVNRACLPTGATPLHIAQKHGKDAVSTLLTDAGASGAGSAGYPGK